MDDDALSYLPDLRLRVRGRPEAMRIVDRSLNLVGRAHSADPAELAALERDDWRPVHGPVAVHPPSAALEADAQD